MMKIPQQKTPNLKGIKFSTFWGGGIEKDELKHAETHRRRKMKVCQEAGIFWRKGFEIRV